MVLRNASRSCCQQKLSAERLCFNYVIDSSGILNTKTPRHETGTTIADRQLLTKDSTHVVLEDKALVTSSVVSVEHDQPQPRIKEIIYQETLTAFHERPHVVLETQCTN